MKGAILIATKVQAAHSRKKCIEQKRRNKNFIYIHIKPVNPIGEKFYRAHSNTHTRTRSERNSSAMSIEPNKQKPKNELGGVRTNDDDDDDRKQKRCAKKQFEHFAGIFLLLLCNHNPNLQTIHYTVRRSVFIYWRCSYVMALPPILLLLLLEKLHFSMNNIFRTTKNYLFKQFQRWSSGVLHNII